MKENPLSEFIKDAKTVPEFLRRARVARGYTLKRIEERTNGQVSGRLFSLYEKGHRLPTERMCHLIATALELDSEELLWRVQVAKAPASIKHLFPERTKTRELPSEERLDDCYEWFCHIVRRIPAHRRKELMRDFETLALKYQNEEPHVYRS